MQFPWPKMDSYSGVWGHHVLWAATCLCAAAWAAAAPIDTNRLALQVEALKRLKGTDFESKPALKAAVQRVLQASRGTPQFVELVRELKIKGEAPALIDYATQHSADASGVD